MASKSIGSKVPRLPHLGNSKTGIAGEVNDLRGDCDEGFTAVETPGHGGTGVVAVDEWTNPLAADDDYVKTTVSAGATATTVTTMTNGTLPHARNLTATCTVTGTGEGEVVVTGTDINGDATHEHFAVPAGGGVVTGSKAFKTVTSILIPALTVGMTGLDVKVGSGPSLGLGSKVKLRNATAAILVEMEDGVPVGGAGVSATATNQNANVTLNTEAAHTHAITGATPAITAMRFAGHVRYVNPIAAELITVSADALMADGARVIAAQPDFPRKLQVRITDADNSVTGDLTLVGLAIDGSAVTQVIPLTGGTRTVITDAVYASLTSATISSIAGAGAGDNMSIGVGAALGLPIPAGATLVAVTKTLVDDTNETVAGVDATARAVAPTTAANGVHDYDFYYQYAVTPVQAAHDHGAATGTGSAHTHTQTAAHTHTQNAHSHGGTTPGTVSAPTVGTPNGVYTPTNAPNGARDYCLVYERDNS